jgi:hypothetical protein
MAGGAAVKSSDEDRAQLNCSLRLAPLLSLILCVQGNNDVSARTQAEAHMFNQHYTAATIPADRVKYGESDFDAITRREEEG